MGSGQRRAFFGGMATAVVLVACRPAAAPAPAAAQATAPAAALAGPRTGVDAAAFARGRAIFHKEFTAAEGLGPHFNQPSCLSCHQLPAAGGHEGMAKAARISLLDQDVNGFPQQALPGYPPLTTPPGKPVSMLRPPPLFGLGLIHDLADAAIEGQCGRDAALGITGVANLNPGEGRVGRFGYKGHTSSLRNFIANALNLEMGLTNPAERDSRHFRDADAVADPELATATVDDLVTYVYGLPPPPAAAPDPVAEALFAQVGCATCHRPLTAPGVAAYSDLCVHDLGPAFDNGLTDFRAGPRQWRTAPLWGLRWRARYFHDDRAGDLADAIARHDGEAAAVRGRYAALPAADQARLLAWLKTL